MLTKLFGSQARVKLLKVFLLNADKQYYIRQLARRLDLQINAVRRELENLEKIGLIIVRWPALANGENQSASQPANPKKQSGGQEKKYYQVNTNFVLYEELRALFVKAQIWDQQNFVNKIKQIGHLKLLVLTGFFVGDNQSPVDLLLVGRLPKQKLSALIKQLEKNIEREVNYSVMDLAEFKYRRDVTDVFLYNILEGKKIIVVDELGLKAWFFSWACILKLLSRF